MADTAEKTGGGATRVLFGTLGFILIMDGTEHMNSASFWSTVDWKLVAVGALCIYAAFFWERAKKHLSAETQGAIAHFAQHGATKAVLLLCVLLTITLSPFVEQHRWPFSYPADPQVEKDNNDLKDHIRQDALDLDSAIQRKNAALAREKELADKWRFATVLRRGIPCGYQMRMTSKASSTGGFWTELLQYGGWNARAGGVALAPAPGSTPSGITIRIKGGAVSTQCAGDLQKALTDIYPNPQARVSNNQECDFLASCPDCVQIEIDY